MWNSWQQDILPKHEMLKDDTLGAFHGITTNIIDTGNFIANAATLDFSFQGKPLQPIQDKINTGFSHFLSENGSERFYNVSNAWNTTISLTALALGGSGVVKGVLSFGNLAKTPRSYIPHRPASSSVSSQLLKNKQQIAIHLFESWDKGTFPNKMQSLRYHLKKHGSNMSANEYTKKALECFHSRKNLANKVHLLNGKQGYSIKIKESNLKKGGFWRLC